MTVSQKAIYWGVGGEYGPFDVQTEGDGQAGRILAKSCAISASQLV